VFAIATTAMGLCNGVLDSCLTPAPPGPPVPVPYPNIAMLMQANRATCTLFVKIMSQPVFTKNSMVMMSAGDEAGSVGGVMSGMIKGPAVPKLASQLVKMGGAPVVYQTCAFGQNGVSANANGILTTPSQPLVLVAG
jgi:hypothetical protein